MFQMATALTMVVLTTATTPILYTWTAVATMSLCSSGSSNYHNMFANAFAVPRRIPRVSTTTTRITLHRDDLLCSLDMGLLRTSRRRFSSRLSSSYQYEKEIAVRINGDKSTTTPTTQQLPRETENGIVNGGSSGGGVVAFQQVDILYGQRSSLIYDPVQERYVSQIDHGDDSPSTNDGTNGDRQQQPQPQQQRRKKNAVVRFYQETLLPHLSVAFLPAGVTSNYYSFMKWRFLQRFVNANLQVFGTQSLLLGLGITSKIANMKSASAIRNHVPAVTAALNWVLKDALGKIVRMLWASRMGRRFDSDAKRWRFRSSFVFAAGNGLEIITYIFPAWFLLFATLANCCKQVSMLTNSSTRTAIYNSFRDGTRENIGDITAKGEAQIAIVDLLGIASGVCLSRAVGTSIKAVFSVYVLLQVLEIFFVYQSLRAVQYRVLNFERMVQIITDFCNSFDQQEQQQLDLENKPTTSSTTTEKPLTINGSGQLLEKYFNNNKNVTDIVSVQSVDSVSSAVESAKSTTRLYASSESSNTTDVSMHSVDSAAAAAAATTSTTMMQTPQQMARTERIFLPPRHLWRRTVAFGSLGRAKLSPEELSRLLDIFKKERFLLVVGRNVKNPKKQTSSRNSASSSSSTVGDILSSTQKKNGLGKVWNRISKNIRNRKTKQQDEQVADAVERIQEHCHIVLHSEATNMDIVKSTLALIRLRRKLAQETEAALTGKPSIFGRTTTSTSTTQMDPDSIRTRDCMDLIESSLYEADKQFSKLLRQLTKLGWESPGRFLFGRVHMRADWPLLDPAKSKKKEAQP